MSMRPLRHPARLLPVLLALVALAPNLGPVVEPASTPIEWAPRPGARDAASDDAPAVSPPLVPRARFDAKRGDATSTGDGNDGAAAPGAPVDAAPAAPTGEGSPVEDEPPGVPLEQAGEPVSGPSAPPPAPAPGPAPPPDPPPAPEPEPESPPDDLEDFPGPRPDPAPGPEPEPEPGGGLVVDISVTSVRVRVALF